MTRSDADNGHALFVGNQNKYMTDEGNAITIGLDTQTVFYQPHSFYTGQNVQVLRNPHLNKYNALYMTIMIRRQMVKFNWGGNGATLGRLKKLSLLLPSADDNAPDYCYMEGYMRLIEMGKLLDYINYKFE